MRNLAPGGGELVGTSLLGGAIDPEALSAWQLHGAAHLALLHHREAALSLGQMHENGLVAGGVVNRTRALELYRYAAEVDPLGGAPSAIAAVALAWRGGWAEISAELYHQAVGVLTKEYEDGYDDEDELLGDDEDGGVV